MHCHRVKSLLQCHCMHPVQCMYIINLCICICVYVYFTRGTRKRIQIVTGEEWTRRRGGNVNVWCVREQRSLEKGVLLYGMRFENFFVTPRHLHGRAHGLGTKNTPTVDHCKTLCLIRVPVGEDGADDINRRQINFCSKRVRHCLHIYISLSLSLSLTLFLYIYIYTYKISMNYNSLSLIWVPTCIRLVL